MPEQTIKINVPEGMEVSHIDRIHESADSPIVISLRPIKKPRLSEMLKVSGKKNELYHDIDKFVALAEQNENIIETVAVEMEQRQLYITGEKHLGNWASRLRETLGNNILPLKINFNESFSGGE